MMVSRCVYILILSCLTLGCASTHPAHSANNSADDPLETYNRAVYKFNTVVDKVIFRPITKTYAFIVPAPVDQGVGNFFSNLDQIPRVANDALQGDIVHTVRDTWRFAINSTVGILGLFDVASKIGLEDRSQDFGLTLAKWGIKNSPYFVLPLLGPSTLRDTLSLPVDYYAFSVWPQIKPSGTHYSLYALQLIHQRKMFLAADQLIDEAFDPYVFVRSAYLQKRVHLIQRQNSLPR